MTDIKERAMKVLPPSEYIGEGARHYYIQGATDQQKIDKELFIELLYNLMEVGDIDVHDINKVIELINKKIGE